MCWSRACHYCLIDAAIGILCSAEHPAPSRKSYGPWCTPNLDTHCDHAVRSSKGSSTLGQLSSRSERLVALHDCSTQLLHVVERTGTGWHFRLACLSVATCPPELKAQVVTASRHRAGCPRLWLRSCIVDASRRLCLVAEGAVVLSWHSMALHGSSVRLVPVPADSKGGVTRNPTTLSRVLSTMASASRAV